MKGFKRTVLAWVWAVIMITGCNNRSKPDKAHDEIIETADSETQAVRMLKEFYTLYITENAGTSSPETIGQLRSKYMTGKLLAEWEAAGSDYDPLLNAQDCDLMWIKTLNIQPAEENTYTVCYQYNPDHRNCITLSLVNLDGNYLIDDIRGLLPEYADEPEGVVSECTLDEGLSARFRFSLQQTEYLTQEIRITIENTVSSTTQVIVYEPGPLYGFEELCYGISYFGNHDRIDEGLEGHHNFIIADYNFDGLEDFAILKDVGGSGGSWFSYYFQDQDGLFHYDEDFPLNDEPTFPVEINSSDKTLKITHPVGAMKVVTNIFQLDNDTWNLIVSEVVTF